ncbi:MAG: crotonase/enoyl-CoA hydratase family protein [Alphaproteobacteria bacterium]|nr:crotonase/enoyl-CoA hydratase family protein [Alphaproteobacteria bacterium]
MPANVEFQGDIAIIRMDDGKANAINPTMLEALNNCLDEAEAKAKAIILVGRDQRFSGGFDLKLMMGLPGDEVAALVKGGGRLAMRLYASPVPIIAACTGHAIAMGCFLLLSSDYRIGAAGPYKIGANESAINMVLPVFALELLKDRLSPRHLSHAGISANLYDPDGARDAGFLDEVVESEAVFETALAMAKQLSAVSGPAYASNKKLLRKHVLETVTPTVTP